MHAFLFFTANKTGKSIVSRGRVRKKEETGNVKRAAASSFSTLPSLLCYAAAKWRREKKDVFTRWKKEDFFTRSRIWETRTSHPLFSLSSFFISSAPRPLRKPGSLHSKWEGGEGEEKILDSSADDDEGGGRANVISKRAAHRSLPLSLFCPRS